MKGQASFTSIEPKRELYEEGGEKGELWIQDEIFSNIPQQLQHKHITHDPWPKNAQKHQ